MIRPLNALGETASATGRFDEAGRWHHEALAVCRSLGEQGSLPSILCDIAHLELELGNITAAHTAALQALEVASHLGNAVGVANALDALARQRLSVGNPERAVELWAEADLLHTELGLPVEQRDKPALERAQNAARRILGPVKFAQHWAIGQDSTDHQPSA